MQKPQQSKNNIQILITNKLKRLTLFDYFMGILLVGITVFFIFTFSRTERTVLVDLTFERVGQGNNFFPPEYWAAENITVGDVVYNALGNKIASVIKVSRVPWRGGSRLYTYLTIELKALYHKANRTYSYEGSALAVGQKLTFLIRNTNYTGIVKNIYVNDLPPSPDAIKSAQASLYCREYEPWHADAIKNLTVKDQNGKIKAEVLSSQIVPAQIAVETSDGRIIEARHPYKKDLDLTVALYDLKCTDNTMCLYNETQSFFIGSELWLDSGTTWVGARCSVKNFTLLK
ncbi:MAG: hypothetical protein AAB800_03620 [Patescibacteria group bacterium]